MQVVIQLEVVMAKNAKTEVKTFFEDFFSNFPFSKWCISKFSSELFCKIFQFLLNFTPDASQCLKHLPVYVREGSINEPLTELGTFYKW